MQMLADHLVTLTTCSYMLTMKTHLTAYGGRIQQLLAGHLNVNNPIYLICVSRIWRGFIFLTTQVSKAYLSFGQRRQRQWNHLDCLFYKSRPMQKSCFEMFLYSRSVAGQVSRQSHPCFSIPTKFLKTAQDNDFLVAIPACVISAPNVE